MRWGSFYGSRDIGKPILKEVWLDVKTEAIALEAAVGWTRCARIAEGTPMSIVNQYSFLWIAAIAFGGLLLLYRRRPRRELALSAGALALGCLIAFLLFSPEASEPTLTSAADDVIGAGTPVLLEFQSPY